VAAPEVHSIETEIGISTLLGNCLLSHILEMMLEILLNKFEYLLDMLDGYPYDIHVSIRYEAEA
jgi:hypothetical protein